MNTNTCNDNLSVYNEHLLRPSYFKNPITFIGVFYIFLSHYRACSAILATSTHLGIPLQPTLLFFFPAFFVGIKKGLAYSSIFIVVHDAVQRRFVLLLAVRQELGPLLAGGVDLGHERLSVVVLVIAIGRVLQLSYFCCCCCVIFRAAATHAADAVTVLFYLAR